MLHASLQNNFPLCTLQKKNNVPVFYCNSKKIMITGLAGLHNRKKEVICRRRKLLVFGFRANSLHSYVLLLVRSTTTRVLLQPAKIRSAPTLPGYQGQQQENYHYPTYMLTRCAQLPALFPIIAIPSQLLLVVATLCNVVPL